MIEIADKARCCGCSACVQACPQQCISFDEDEHGFRYPKVYENLCVGCGLCESVCPELNEGQAQTPVKVFAASNPDEGVRKDSSSGGAFSALASTTIEGQGVVFGSIFNDSWEVVHAAASNLDELKAMRGSKYAQSVIGDSFAKADSLLKDGKDVLFCGTGCQIAGLKRFLGKDCDRLLCVEVACHGVPSPLVWKKYLEAKAEGKPVKAVSFRSKKNGWKKYNVLVEGEYGAIVDEVFCDNAFMKLFLSNLILRPSCHECQFKSGRSGSDIILADFWGVDRLHPELDDDKGLSAIIVNTQKGLQAIQESGLECHEVSYEDVTWKNSSLLESATEPTLAAEFWEDFTEKGIEEASKLLKHFEPSTLQKLRTFCVKVKKSLLD